MGVLNGSTKNQLLLFVIATIHVYWLLNLVFYFYGEFLIFPYLIDQGWIPYKNVIDQHFPGLMLTPLNFRRFGIDTIYDLRILQVCLVFTAHMTLYLTAKKLTNGKNAIYANLFYLIIQPFYEGYSLWIDSLLPVPLLLSLYFLLDIVRGNANKHTALLSGLMIGFSVLIKQNVLFIFVLLITYLFLIKKYRKFVVYFVLGTMIVFLPFINYLWLKDILKEFIYWTVIFNINTYSSMAGTLKPEMVFRSIPLILIVFLYIYKLASKNENSEKYKFVLIYALGAFTIWTFRDDLVHLQPVLPFISLLFLVVFTSTRIKLIVIIILGLVLNLFVLINFKTHKLIFAPANGFIKTLVDDIQSLTDEGDEVYLRGVPYYVYQFTNTLPPGRLFVYELPWYKKVLGDKIDNNVIKTKPKIIVIKFTKHTNLSLSKFIKNNYKQIKSYNKVDMYMRN